MNLSASLSPSPKKVSHSLQRLLNAYTTAATAAGVGVLALTQPAEAEVLYTPVHKHINANTVLNIDLNHDGIVDFQISYYYTYRNLRPRTKPLEGTFLLYRRVYAIGAQPSNMVESAVVKGRAWAAALAPRALIGPEAAFQAGKQMMADFSAFGNNTQGGEQGGLWPWLGATRRYLGFKFLIDGATHYGWARLNVSSYCTGAS